MTVFVIIELLDIPKIRTCSLISKAKRPLCQRSSAEVLPFRVRVILSIDPFPCISPSVRRTPRQLKGAKTVSKGETLKKELSEPSPPRNWEPSKIPRGSLDARRKEGIVRPSSPEWRVLNHAVGVSSPHLHKGALWKRRPFQPSCNRTTLLKASRRLCSRIPRRMELTFPQVWI